MQPEENGTTEGKFDETYEKCVLCGCRVEVKKDLLIDFRDNYVEGCGQLCMRCSQKVLDLQNSNGNMSDRIE